MPNIETQIHKLRVEMMVATLASIRIYSRNKNAGLLFKRKYSELEALIAKRTPSLVVIDHINDICDIMTTEQDL